MGDCFDKYGRRPDGQLCDQNSSLFVPKMCIVWGVHTPEMAWSDISGISNSFSSPASLSSA
jgi:hypothetical protein